MSSTYRAVIVALAMALTSCASSGQSKPESPLSVKGAFFALSVSDMDRVAAWYVQNLDFKIELKKEPATEDPRGMILSRDGARLELLEFATAKSRADWGLVEAHEMHGILKIGFEVRDIDAVFASAKARDLNIFSSRHPTRLALSHVRLARSGWQHRPVLRQVDDRLRRRQIANVARVRPQAASGDFRHSKEEPVRRLRLPGLQTAWGEVWANRYPFRLARSPNETWARIF